MQNSLHAVPQYTLHRSVIGAPVAADTTDLAALHTAKKRNSLNCRGFETVHVFVRLQGGAAPTVDLVPLVRVKYTDQSGTAQDIFVPLTAATGALSDSGFATVTASGAPIFFRITAVTGSPTAVQIYVAGLLKQGIEGPY